MSKIIELEINNYRCIKSFHEKFDRDVNAICFIGRGDSGKTTILDAIASVLSPAWNLAFYDTDFYNCNIDEPIEISASLIELPENLLLENKFGLHHRALNPANKEIEDEITDDCEKVLTIKLRVDKSLEPKWIVTNNRPQEDKDISASDRAMLNCFMISDEIDRHFSWNKGSPLYSLLRLNDNSIDQENKSNIIDAVRDTKSNIDPINFSNLTETVNIVKNKTAAFGLDISNTQTTIDFKDLHIRENRISLHDDNIPFRLKGKGSKRLVSIAIQSAISEKGGIVLIDEIEQGLEPDRTKQLVRSLKDEHEGQIFMTTHSRDVITELKSKYLRIIHRNNSNIKIASVDYSAEELQKVIRACPEAFFAKRIIVCEGSTEVGICRAMDKYRKNCEKELLSFKDCAYVDGTGSSFAQRASEIKKAEFKVALFCDSDANITPSKDELVKQGVKIFDCEEGNNIEKQVFCDLPWVGVKELLDYALNEIFNANIDSLKQAVEVKYGPGFPEDWVNSESNAIRKAVAEASVVDKNEWFKRIDRGEYLGNIIFKHFEVVKDKHLGKRLSGMSEWVDS